MKLIGLLFFVTFLASCQPLPCPAHSKPRVFEQGGKWSSVGSISYQDAKWDIKIYRFDNPETLHGYQQLTFFKNGRYVGGYDMGANEQCKMEGATVDCWGEFPEHDIVTVKSQGPPRKTIFGGYEADLCDYDD